MCHNSDCVTDNKIGPEMEKKQREFHPSSILLHYKTLNGHFSWCPQICFVQQHRNTEIFLVLSQTIAFSSVFYY